MPTTLVDFYRSIRLNSKYIKLGTTTYYRDWEESDRGGIGDSEEGTLRRHTDFATFQREAGQTPLSGAHHAQISLTYKREYWILCTSIAPRTIAKSGGTAIEAGDGLDGAEGAAFGSQGHGHPGGEPSVQAQGV